MVKFFYFLSAKFLNLLADKRAVTAIEYALIAVAISAMLFIVLGSGDEGIVAKIKQAFKSVEEALSTTKEKGAIK